MARQNQLLLIGSRKGLIVYKKQGQQWEYHTTHFLGIPVTLADYDPYTATWWALLNHGHWGCKIHRSKDGQK